MTIKQIKEKDYINANELRQLIPGMGQNASLNIIKEVQKEMKEKKLYVPKVRPFVALTKLVLEKLGI